MGDERRPAWARRLAAERQARGWTQQDAIAALRRHAERVLPEDAHLLRTWKGWEAGRHRPGVEYQRAIAATFGSVSAAIFGPPPSGPARTGGTYGEPDAGTLEIVQRLRRSDVDAATLDTLRVVVDRLCSEYPYVPSADLEREGRRWMHHLTRLLDGRLTLAQHREVLVLAGWLALLVGCVQYDMTDTAAAEASRRAALALGEESGHAEISGWAYEMRCWFALTQGRYGEVVAAARAGAAVAGRTSVGVQLAAQEAKAWARMGDRRHSELALERGRTLLESLPYPDDVENHFAVDPDKFDFYAMDCYRIAGNDAMSGLHAREVIRKSTAPDGTVRAPMRVAEARITLGVAAARQGDLESAVASGRAAVEGARLSVPSLVMVGQDLARELRHRFPDEPATREYVDLLRSLPDRAAAPAP